MGGITTGSANANGTVNTQGPSGTALSTVVAANCTTVNGVDATGAGLCATAVSNGTTALGSNAQATAENATAIGFRALATYKGAVAIGYNAQAIADPTVAIGDNSLASGNDAVALGASAQATANNSVALGANSVANQANTVSVGSAGNERRITNVAAGVNATDAVNVSQLYQSNQNIYNQINNVSRVAYTGIAMSMAMSANYMPTLEPGEKALGLGAGTYQGYGAFAVNFRQLSESGKTSWGFAISTDGKNYGANVGIGYKWK